MCRRTILLHNSVALGFCAGRKSRRYCGLYLGLDGEGWSGARMVPALDGRAEQLPDQG